MILFVATETAEKYRNGGGHKAKMTLEDRAKDHCLVVHYKQVSRKLLRDVQPWAICHSGRGTPFDQDEVLTTPGYRWAIRSSGVPQIGFCGGHQIIAAYFGSTLGNMRPIGPDDADHCPTYHPGLFKEYGTYPVRVVQRDPLFRGLPDVFRVHEAHRQEVKELSPDLVLLASSADCRVQAFLHRRKTIYGTQFHPEAASEHSPDGFRILANFFRIARAYKPKG